MEARRAGRILTLACIAALGGCGVRMFDRWNGRQAILVGVDARAARELYANGALIVYPVQSRGCLVLSQP